MHMHPMPASKYAERAVVVPLSKFQQALAKSDTLIKIASAVGALVFVYLGV